MSDTTTITPEERARLRAYAAGCNVEPHLHSYLCHIEPDTVLRLLTALEAAEAENARLRAERDWLAENVEGRPCDYDSCPFGLPRPTGPDYGCGKTHVQCWQKALTSAVAAGEGE